MSCPPNNLKTYRMIDELGRGGFAVVVKAVDDSTGALIAYKKCRSSLRTKRPALRHESRIMQLLQGHPAIPKIFGYQHVVHFEHITMELLGPSLKQLLKSGCAVSSVTVLRVGEQLISALQHLLAHNIVHRDVKPSNVCVSIENPAQVCLIDYGISIALSPEAMKTPSTKRFDPLQGDKPIIGTVDYCSLNAHDGMWSRPRDDAESLGYTLFYLYFGGLPWLVEECGEKHPNKLQRVHDAKESFLHSLPLVAVPPLDDLLRVSRASLGNGDLDLPLQRVQEDMRRFVASSGQTTDGALDWTPVPPPPNAPAPMEFTLVTESSESMDRRFEELLRLQKAGLLPRPDPTERLDSAYWLELRRVRSRDSSLTFEEEEGVFLDSIIPDAGCIID